MAQEVKKEPKDVPVQYPDLSWALASSTTKIEQHSPVFLSTIERSAWEASLLGVVCSSSYGAFSSNIVYLDKNDDDDVSIDWDELENEKD